MEAAVMAEAVVERGAKAEVAAAEVATPDRMTIALVPALGPEEIDRELRLADRQTDTGHRRLAFYLADMEVRGICQLLGYATATVYAVKRLEMGRRHAQQLIAVGRALEELPKIDAAFCQGRLNWSRVRLLAKIAVPETEAAWVERAVALGWSDFEREVLTSERGRPPRAARRGLPQVKIGVVAKLDRLGYEAWELAKRKLGDERGEPMSDAEFMAAAAHLVLGTRADGTVPGRERLNDSNYRIVIDRCSECSAGYLQTAEGPAELPAAGMQQITCDAKVAVMAQDARELPQSYGPPPATTSGRATPTVTPTPRRRGCARRCSCATGLRAASAAAEPTCRPITSPGGRRGA